MFSHYVCLSKRSPHDLEPAFGPTAFINGFQSHLNPAECKRLFTFLVVLLV